MKKSIFALLLVLSLFGCSSNSKQNNEGNEDVLRGIYDSRKLSLEKDGIFLEYDSVGHRMRLTSKGDIMTVSYNVTYTDLTGSTPKSYANDFIVSMVVAKKGAQTISSVDFVIEGVKVKVVPSNSESIGNGFVICGLNTLDKPFCDVMQTLQDIVYVEDAFVVTDKGSIRVPTKDIMNLLSMAHSYILDGGSFEYKLKL